jgi:hypothetical protein
MSEKLRSLKSRVRANDGLLPGLPGRRSVPPAFAAAADTAFLVAQELL